MKPHPRRNALRRFLFENAPRPAPRPIYPKRGSDFSLALVMEN